MDKRVQEVEKELKPLKRELTETDQIMRDMQTRRNVVAKKVQQLENQLKQLMKPKDLVVSDHALLRYMERRQGIAVEEVRQEIREALIGATDLGSLKFKGFVVQGHTVVTYVEPTQSS